MAEKQQLCVDAVRQLVGVISCQRTGEQDGDACEILRGVYQQAAMEAAHSTMRISARPHEVPALVITYAARISHIVRSKLKADAGMTCGAAKEKMVAYLLKPKGAKDPVKMIACRAAAAILAEVLDAWVVDKQAAAGGNLRRHILSSKHLKCAQEEARLAFTNRTRCQEVPWLFQSFYETFAERARQSHLEEGRSWKTARQGIVNNLLRQRLPGDPARAVTYVSAALLLAAIPPGPSPEYGWPTLSAAGTMAGAKEKADKPRSGSRVGDSCTSAFFAGSDHSDAPPPASSAMQLPVLGSFVPILTTTPMYDSNLLTTGPTPEVAGEMNRRGLHEQSLGQDTCTQSCFTSFSDHEASTSAASSVLPGATRASLVQPSLAQHLAAGTGNHIREERRGHTLELEDTASRRNDIEWLPTPFLQAMPASAEPATVTPNAAAVTSEPMVPTAAVAEIARSGLHRTSSVNGHAATTSGFDTTPVCGVRKDGPCLDVYARKSSKATLFTATAAAKPAAIVVRSGGPVAEAAVVAEAIILPLVRPPSSYGSGSCLDPWIVDVSPGSTDTAGFDGRGGDMLGLTRDHDFDGVARYRNDLAPCKQARRV